MNSLRYFIPWLFRRMFGNLGIGIRDLHRQHIRNWQNDWVGCILATVVVNGLVFMIAAAFQGLTKISAASSIMVFWAVEILYFIFAFFHCQWVQFNKEKEKTFNQLKSK